MLELQLDTGGEKCGAFEQPGDHGIRAVPDQSAKAFGDAGIFFGEISRLLVQQGQFAIVEVQEFAIHCLEPVDMDIAGVELDVGDEFDGNVERLGNQIGVDDEAQFELLGSDRAVAAGPDGLALEPRFKVEQCGAQRVLRSSIRDLVDRASARCRESHSSKSRFGRNPDRSSPRSIQEQSY